jgi:hypothetical protein
MDYRDDPDSCSMGVNIGRRSGVRIERRLTRPKTTSPNLTLRPTSSAAGLIYKSKDSSPPLAHVEGVRYPARRQLVKSTPTGHYRFLKGRQTPSSARLSRHKGQAKETPPARIQTSPNK